MSTIQADSHVTLHYRLLLNEQEAFGEIVSTFDDKPATIQMGMGQLSPGLEARLLGLTESHEASFELSPEEGFGPRNPELIQKISRATLTANSPTDTDYQPGDIVDFPRPDGGRYAGVLKTLTPDYALFDFNHPLAGKALRFDVKIIGVL
ncbi:FKBP-type peptidyl-prolyl cis-trans isomerase [Parvibium lacunae]|uniref:Peptidyl-prolyl cis-trans isomerase n=1 Tax=Parvibium lacunae TaxID=1888893 RepID=A0A368L537_9BURK|nr:peptidylprolyl isomerase [Parvibium lacunae]RCS58699.1 peptidylprolyl isomerase [Parvibium lacunae]